jgi:hypothetical protein
VTRLGDLSPIGWLFTLSSFLLQKQPKYFYVLPFSIESIVY